MSTTQVSEAIVWVNVSDDLPDEGMTVLVAMSIEASSCYDVDMAYLDSGEWKAIGGGLVRDVTHWSELPQGPVVSESTMKRVAR